jgi:hypothetical protein
VCHRTIHVASVTVGRALVEPLVEPLAMMTRAPVDDVALPVPDAH